MSRVAHVGIVGCSAEGAALCFRTMCAEGPALLGAHVHPEISMHVPPLVEYVQRVEAGDLAGVGELMLMSAHKLVAAGADVLICPDNTIHAALDGVVARVTRPWLHIAEVVADAAVARGFRRVGLLGTRWLVTGDVYPARLAARGLAVVVPDARDVDAVHRIIMDELVPARPSAAVVPRLREVIARFAEAGCDAVILGCTELPLVIDDATSPLPVLDSTRLLARAALRWVPSTPREPDVAAFDRLYAKVMTTPLKRTLKEMQPSMTRGYVLLILAYGYARLGRPDRVSKCISEAHDAIAERDAVHAWLFAAYEARIAQVLAGVPRETPMPDALIAQRDALGMRELYIVDRLRGSSMILEPVVTVDAMGAFQRAQRDARGPDIERLSRLATVARAAEIARLIEFAATRTDEDERILGGAYDHLLGLPADLAWPIWKRATQLVAEAPPSTRATLYARALVVAGYFGHLELDGAAVVADLCAAIAHAPLGALGWALARALRTLQHRDRDDDVRALIAAYEARPLAAREPDLVARAAYAGAVAWLGEPQRAWRDLRPLHAVDHGGISSAAARACASFPAADRAGMLDDLAGHLHEVGDVLSTHSHYSLAILDFVEGLVLGATGG